MVHQKAPTCFRFRFAQGFGTRALAQTLDSLVRVSRRVAHCHYASTLAEARSSAGAGRIQPQATTPRRAEFPGPFHGRPSRCWPIHRGVRRPEGRRNPGGRVLTACGSPATISRTVSPSFQSAFRLSITLLVRYRSPADI